MVDGRKQELMNIKKSNGINICLSSLISSQTLYTAINKQGNTNIPVTVSI